MKQWDQCVFGKKHAPATPRGAVDADGKDQRFVVGLWDRMYRYRHTHNPIPRS